MFELEGDDDLDDLALEARFSGVRKKPRANCMVSVEPPAAFGRCEVVAVNGFDDHAPVVDAAVLKEAAVFDGEHGLHQVGRNLVVGDEAALGAVGVVAQAGDEQRLKLVAGERLAVVVGDGLDNAGTDA
jgi:hypothetical protein